MGCGCNGIAKDDLQRVGIVEPFRAADLDQLVDRLPLRFDRRWVIVRGSELGVTDRDPECRTPLSWTGVRSGLELPAPE